MMKNMVITGVTGGLGRFLAKEYLEDGWKVFGYDVEERDVEEFFSPFKDTFVFKKLDVKETDAVEAMAKEIEEKIDCLDLLINCAGILPENSANVIENFEVDGSLEVFNVNALGPLRMIKALLPLLRKAKEPMILNVSSEAGSMQAHADYTFRYDYCMSKAALNIQSIIMQRYLEKEKIRVLPIHPGWMRTEMGGQEAPLLPEDAAVHIKALVEAHKYDYENRTLYDYDGVTRPW